MIKQNNLFVVRALIAPSYSDPTFTSSKVTEVLCGETVKILDTYKDWLQIEQNDGYISWLKSFYGTFETRPFKPDCIAMDKSVLPFGTYLKYENNNLFSVNNERYGSNLSRTNYGGNPKPENLIQIARTLLGCPYRWGGKSSLGFDCSGLVQSVFFACGMSLPRDAWQQSKFFNASRIEGVDSKAGDLHFFGESGKISHVGISTGGFNLIHCQGWVKEESFENNKSGNKKLRDIYMHTCSVAVNLNK